MHTKFAMMFITHFLPPAPLRSLPPSSQLHVLFHFVFGEVQFVQLALLTLH